MNHDVKQNTNQIRTAKALLSLIENNLEVLRKAVKYSYVFLFTYTGYSKLNDLEVFSKGLRKVPFLATFSVILAWGVPIIELMLAIGMILPIGYIQKISFRASLVLMGAFTVYLLLMVLFVKEKLCNCGGVIGSLGWNEHLVFNLIILILGLWSIRKMF